MQSSPHPTLTSDWLKAFLKMHAGTRPVLLAVSGGLDSMVLWDLLRKSGHTHAVAHVNYHLRDEESNLDEALIRQVAKAHRVPLHVLADHSISKDSAGLQAAARAVRYDFFKSLSEEYPLLCTAHHADDQVETVLLQLARGGGPKALAGIAQVGATRLRPLLPFSKTELTAYAKTHEVEFREDASNASDQYLRNRVRHHFAPLGEQLFEGFRQNVGKSAQQQQQLLSFAERMVREKVDLLRSSKWPHALDQKKLASVQGLSYFLHELLRKHSFSSETIAAIEYAVLDAKDQKRLFLNRAEDVQLVISGTTLHLESTIPFEEFHLKLDTVGKFKSPVGMMEVIESASFSESLNANELWVSSLEELSWRTLSKNDSLSISDGGSKAAKRVLAEAKLPPLSLHAASVLIDREGPLWIVNVRKSSKHKTKKAKTAGYCLRFTSTLHQAGILAF